MKNDEKLSPVCRLKDLASVVTLRPKPPSCVLGSALAACVQICFRKS